MDWTYEQQGSFFRKIGVSETVVITEIHNEGKYLRTNHLQNVFKVREIQGTNE